MVSDERRARMEAALAQRTAWVACAVEAVHHRHNISAILRTCDALGLHRVHLVEGHFTPVRGAARGAERWLDLRHDLDADAAITALKADGYAVWCADLDENSVAPEQVPIDRPVCLWFGAEVVGVSAAARAAADGVVSIPMYGFMQSLNVSVAAAMTLRAVAERVRLVHGKAALLDDQARAALLARWLSRDDAVFDAVTD